MTGAVQLAGTVPGPVWSHLVRACLQHQSALPAAVMAQFGAFIPGIKVMRNSYEKFVYKYLYFWDWENSIITTSPTISVTTRGRILQR